MNLQEERRDYVSGELDEKKLPSNPFKMFQDWLNTALNQNILDATAMSLATINSNGYPDSRIVLLKDYNVNGFTFFTNYFSKKGKAVEKNNKVSLHFFWAELEQQIRIQGTISKTSREISERYFKSRPVASQIAAIVSNQSSEIKSRKVLEDKYAELEQKPNTQLECPENWGGYIVKPVRFEFWQGRKSRLHDRVVYEQIKETSWNIKRLAP